jgi:hypothetical protein
MKKTIIAILVTVCVMTIIGGVYINYINDCHVKEIEGLTNQYEERIGDLKDNYRYLNNDYERLSEDMDELENQVYNMMNGEYYDISVDQDGITYGYVYERGDGLFDRTYTYKIY